LRVTDVLLAVGLAELFPGMAPLGHGEFRALRDSAASPLSRHQLLEQRLLHVESVFRLVEDS